MELTPDDIKLILSTLQESGYDEAEVIVGDTRIAVARGGATLAAAPAPAPAAVPAAAPAAAAPAAAAPAAPAAPAPTALDPADTVVTAPSVGVFWRAPEPGAAPFVEVGSTVAVGDTIGIVEVMKLMSNIAADVAGTVTAVHADNAQGVEFGTPLVSIRPAS
jgi:acetyl-CoA carboxylase biotin carboxyl carrier protein